MTKEVDGNKEAFGVETTADGDVQINLGHIPPFTLPADVAIKLAALILKKSKCHVMARPTGLRVKYPSNLWVFSGDKPAASPLPVTKDTSKLN